MAAAPQALRGFTISAGRSAFPRTTVSSRMEPTEPALHTRRCRLLPLCDEKSLSALVAAAAVLTGADQNAVLKEQSESIRDEQT